jgi:hypothetical protein
LNPRSSAAVLRLEFRLPSILLEIVNYKLYENVFAFVVGGEKEVCSDGTLLKS